VKAFVEFYNNSTGWNGVDFSGPFKWVPTCGSDGYRALDSRWSLRRMHGKATKLTVEHFRGSVRAYRLFRGNLRSSTPVSGIITVQKL